MTLPAGEPVMAGAAVPTSTSVFVPVSEAAAMPTSVRALVAGRRAYLVWENELGGRTFEVDADPDRFFVKWTPVSSGIDLSQEVARLQWAASYIVVPRLLDQGADDAGSWIVTAALPGHNAVIDRWKAEPDRAVRAIGEGLRALHEALPIASCPFSWATEARLDDARRRAAAGSISVTGWHEIHQPLGLQGALDVLADVPPVDQLVVCHGDACAPNTLLGVDGHWSGHVDVGATGIADRWADLAVATWSTEWNYGPGWDGELLAAYGIEPDPDRTAYYRLLQDLGP